MYVGEYEQALSYLQEVEDLAVRTRVIEQQANALGLEAQCWYRLDRWDEVLATEEKWRDLERRYTRERVGETGFFVALSASVHALRGDLERTNTYRKESYDYMVSVSGLPDNWQRNQFYGHALPLKAKGEFALLQQNLTLALEKSGQPVKRGTMAHDHHLYMLLADTAAQQRDENALNQYTPRLEALALRDSHQLYLGIAHRAWGVAHWLAGEHDKAAERLTQALELFHNLGTRWQTGRTRFEMGELNLAKGEKDRARNHFSFALEAFEAMKAMPDVERTRVKLETISGTLLLPEWGLMISSLAS